MNDLNVLTIIPFFNSILPGTIPCVDVSYETASEIFDWIYILADGIYPEYEIIMNNIFALQGKKAERLVEVQEAARKSVERVFCVLFKWFGVLQRPSRFWFSSDMQKVTQACCPIHNLLIENRKEWFIGNGVRVVRQNLADGEAEALDDFSLVPYHTDREKMDAFFPSMAEIPKEIRRKTKLL